MNIYVGNLNYEVNSEDLKQIFEEYGAVAEVKLISDKYSGKSKGFGFVTMENNEEAESAVNGLNGATLENRQLVVNEARERKTY